MPVNPLDLQDLVKVPILIVQGSQPTGSVARAILVSTFAATLAFPGRQKRYSGTPAEWDAALAADGFAANSFPRQMAAAFGDNELPVDEVVIGRRDSTDDLTWTATLQALDAEDNTWCLIAAETRTKAEQLQVADYMEARWGYYRTLSREPGVPNKQAGTFVDAAFVKKYHHTSATYYDAEVATNFSPPVILSGPGTFLIENGWTLKLNVQGGLTQTFTFVATPASILGSNTEPFVLVDGTTIVVEVDALGELTIDIDDVEGYWPNGIGAATAADVVEYLNDFAPQVTWSVDTGAVRATSQRKGTSSFLDFTGGAAATVLGLSGDDNGTGDFAFADAATAAELATKINATGTDFEAEAVGTRLRLTGDTSGKDQYIELLESEVLGNLGLEVGKYYGEGVTEDWHDCAVLGVLAQLAARLDSPGGRFPLDNQKLRGRPGQKLTSTQRRNVWEQFCDTYEPRTDNYPGELHLGVSFSGANVDFVIGLLHLQLRMVEDIKRTKDSYAARKLNIPYGDDGIAIIDNTITARLQQSVANGVFAAPLDLSPFNTLVKVTGYKRPTIAEQSSANKAAGKVSGWKTTQLDAGAIKIVEVEITASTQ